MYKMKLAFSFFCISARGKGLFTLTRGQLNESLTPSQVHHAVFPAQVGLDLHGEADLFADKLLSQELSGLEGPRLKHRKENFTQRQLAKFTHFR